MAQITRFPVLKRYRSEASAQTRLFRGGHLVRDGRGLAFWFDPSRTSIAEIPLSDRELTFLVKSQSADYQDIAVQGTVLWSVADVARLSERVDFSIDLRTGRHIGKPEDHIARILNGLVGEFADSYVKELGVRPLLEAGLAPLQTRITEGFAEDPTLDQMGLTVTATRVAALTPDSELARALKAPTFESLQQKADEASFARRALAVDKERAIAENELANRIELASRRSDLIARDDANARAEAEALAEAQKIAAEGAARAKVIAAEAEATRIRAVEQAEADMERARLAAIGTLDAAQLYALAARDFAQKLEKIDALTVTPDMLSGLVRQIGQAAGARG